MVVGIGLDLVEVDRLVAFRSRYGPSGLRRLFTEAELAYCLGRQRPAESLAARFAAKEAVFKALGTGWGRGGRWTDIEVVRAADGAPELRLRGRASERAARLGVGRMHVSLTHSGVFAAAQVVLEAAGGREVEG